MTAFSVYAASRHGSFEKTLPPPPPPRPTTSTLRSSLLSDAARIAHPGDPYRSAAERDGGFAAAVGLYEQGRWVDAFKQLAHLADVGHAPAAKLALLMLRYGAALYGTQLRADASQIARWAGLVIGTAKAHTTDTRLARQQ